MFYSPGIARHSFVSGTSRMKLSGIYLMCSDTSSVHGALHLYTESDPATDTIQRSAHLEAAPDGKTVLLIDVDSRRPGGNRKVVYELAPGDMIAALRAHGAEVNESASNSL
jgi:hypothetical protein